MKLANKFVKVNVKDSSNKWRNVLYNQGTNQLKMTFTNIKKSPTTYQYAGVKPRVIKKWEKAHAQGTKRSAGKFFYHNIRSNYDYEVVKNNQGTGGATVKTMPVVKVENTLPNNVQVFKKGQKFYFDKKEGRWLNTQSLVNKGLARFEDDQPKTVNSTPDVKPSSHTYELKWKGSVKKDEQKPVNNKVRTKKTTTKPTSKKEEAQVEVDEDAKREKGYRVGKSIAVGASAAVGSFLGGIYKRY